LLSPPAAAMAYTLPLYGQRTTHPLPAACATVAPHLVAAASQPQAQYGGYGVGDPAFGAGYGGGMLAPQMLPGMHSGMNGPFRFFAQTPSTFLPPQAQPQPQRIMMDTGTSPPNSMGAGAFAAACAQTSTRSVGVGGTPFATGGVPIASLRLVTDPSPKARGPVTSLVRYATSPQADGSAPHSVGYSFGTPAAASSQASPTAYPSHSSSAGLPMQAPAGISSLGLPYAEVATAVAGGSTIPIGSFIRQAGPIGSFIRSEASAVYDSPLYGTPMAQAGAGGFAMPVGLPTQAHSAPELAQTPILSSHFVPHPQAAVHSLGFVPHPQAAVHNLGFVPHPQAVVPSLGFVPAPRPQGPPSSLHPGTAPLPEGGAASFVALDFGAGPASPQAEVHMLPPALEQESTAQSGGTKFAGADKKKKEASKKPKPKEKGTGKKRCICF